MEISYVLSYKLAKKSKPLTVGTFLKDCMEEAASILCPDKKRSVTQSLSVWK